MPASQNNPYANPNGTPRDGKELQFFAWERKRRLAEIKKLPPEVQKRIRESERRFAARMNS